MWSSRSWAPSGAPGQGLLRAAHREPDAGMECPQFPRDVRAQPPHCRSGIQFHQNGEHARKCWTSPIQFLQASSVDLSYRLPCHPLLMFENNSSIQQSGLTAMVAGVLRVIAPCPPYHGKPRPAVVAAIHRASRPTSASGATVAATFPAPPMQKRRACIVRLKQTLPSPRWMPREGAVTIGLARDGGASS